eukprot:2754694-Rhodomonas_salina.1
MPGTDVPYSSTSYAMPGTDGGTSYAMLGTDGGTSCEMPGTAATRRLVLTLCMGVRGGRCRAGANAR